MIIQLNQYPENYEEELMPQIIVEIRYRKGKKAEATLLAQKIETVLSAQKEKWVEDKTLTLGDILRNTLEYEKDGKKYRKIGRHEKIAEGAMQSWANGNLEPIRNPQTVDDIPAHYAEKRNFYNPINDL